MAMCDGNKLCQWCRKMYPKNNVRFYPKADMKMCNNCVDKWESKTTDISKPVLPYTSWG